MGSCNPINVTISAANPQESYGHLEMVAFSLGHILESFAQECSQGNR
jgi:hypothetical protein